MPDIRTRFRPDLEITVSEHEEGVLRGQNLVVDTTASTPAGAIRAAQRQTMDNAAGDRPPATTRAPRKRASRAKPKPAAPASPTTDHTPAGQQPAGDNTQEG